jgi:elongation factor P
MMFRFLLTTLALTASSSTAFLPCAVAPAFLRVPATTTATALQVAVDTSEIKNGMTLELDGECYKILSSSIMKQARGAAKVTIRMKNLMRGTTIENTYRSGEKFERAEITKLAHQHTYSDDVSIVYYSYFYSLQQR